MNKPALILLTSFAMSVAILHWAVSRHLRSLHLEEPSEPGEIEVAIA